MYSSVFRLPYFLHSEYTAPGEMVQVRWRIARHTDRGRDEKRPSGPFFSLGTDQLRFGYL